MVQSHDTEIKLIRHEWVSPCRGADLRITANSYEEYIANAANNQPNCFVKTTVQEYKAKVMFESRSSYSNLPAGPVSSIMKCLAKFHPIFNLCSDFLNRFQLLPSLVQIEVNPSESLTISSKTRIPDSPLSEELFVPP